MSQPSDKSPTAVTTLLADAARYARQSAEDLEDVIEALPDDAPLLAVVDIVAARAHLVAAQRLIGHAADALEIGAAAVTR